MLQNQHLVVFGSVLPESPRHVGCIDPACDVESVVYDAFENARFLCDRYYLTSPTMKLEMINAVEKVDLFMSFHRKFRGNRYQLLLFQAISTILCLSCLKMR